MAKTHQTLPVTRTNGTSRTASQHFSPARPKLDKRRQPARFEIDNRYRVDGEARTWTVLQIQPPKNYARCQLDVQSPERND